MFSNMLTPIDGSSDAQRALDLAVDLARRYGARLHLLHVITASDVPKALRKLSDRPPLPASAAPNAVPAYEREVAKDVAQVLLERARKAAEEAGVEHVETHWTTGQSAHEILAYAREHRIDLIVIGARGMSPLKGLMIGSVSHKVQQLARCNVITVK